MTEEQSNKFRCEAAWDTPQIWDVLLPSPSATVRSETRSSDTNAVGRILSPKTCSIYIIYIDQEKLPTIPSWFRSTHGEWWLCLPGSRVAKATGWWSRSVHTHRCSACQSLLRTLGIFPGETVGPMVGPTGPIPSGYVKIAMENHHF